jgi:BMFP domain-containing protein YqiC
MQTGNKLFADMAELGRSALGLAAGLREEVEGIVRHQFERMTKQMNLVTREEFDVLSGMLAKARAEQEAMKAQLAALSGKKAEAKPAPQKAAAAKTAAKAGAKKTGKTPAKAKTRKA